MNNLRIPTTFTIRHPIIIWLFLILLIGQFGCAFAPKGPPPLSENVRAQLGTIGVVSNHFSAEANVEPPMNIKSGKTSAAAAGAGAGFGAGLVGAIGCFLTVGHWVEGCLLALATPVLIVKGAFEGAAMAVPAADVEEAEAALKAALADLNIQDAMRERVIQIARDQTRRHFVPVTEQGPSSTSEEVSYASLASEGIDAVLEISVLTFDLASERGVNPPLALFVKVRTRLIRVRDGTTLYDSTLDYGSATRKFTEWAVDNAQPFREELDRAYQSLAERTVSELFGLPPLPQESGREAEQSKEAPAKDGEEGPSTEEDARY